MCTYKSNKPWEGAKKKEQVPGRIGELHSLPLGMDLVLRIHKCRSSSKWLPLGLGQETFFYCLVFYMLPE